MRNSKVAFSERTEYYATMKLHMTTTDRIEKTIVLQAPRSRVWAAISSTRAFGTWFGAKMEGEMKPGARVTARIQEPGFEHLTIDIAVERVEPERVMAFRWHPYPIEPGVDYSNETPTLVEFRLDEAEGGTLLTVTESGFDKIPSHRRAEAFRMNDAGWVEQLKNIERYVAR